MKTKAISSKKPESGQNGKEVAGTENAQITKWGNSLAVRIPKALALSAGITESSPVTLTLSSQGEIIITPVQSSRRRGVRKPLGEYLKEISPQNIHDPVRTGAPQGNELL